MVGRTLRNRYQLRHKIGQGGWSEVYEAFDLQENVPVVAKIMEAGRDTTHDNMVLLFQREAVSLLRYHHRHIVKIVDFGEDQGSCFIIMEHDNGLSLFHYLTTQEWPTISEVVRLMIQITEALQYLHATGSVHQDLKPSNLILKDGRIDQCKIVDFGCVLLKNLVYSSTKQIITGTFPYISPEQLGAYNNVVDHRSDLYSLGVIFYELLSGTRPFPPDMTANDILQGRFDRIVPPSRLNPLIPEVLDRIVMKLIEHDPKNRYQTSAGLLEDLSQYQILSTRTVGSPYFRIGKADAKGNLEFDVPLIGREEELADLRQMLQQAKTKGAMLLLGGETGSGKSRLLEEFRLSLAASEQIYLFSKCSESNINFPYFPLIQIFHDYSEYLSTLSPEDAAPHHAIIREALTPFHTELANLAPAIVKLLPPTPPAAHTDDPTTRMLQFQEKIGEFFATVAERIKPLVVVFEDMHWADAGTCRFLQVLTPMLNERRNLLCILSYRSEEVDDHPNLKELLNRVRTNKGNLVWLRVSPLPPMTVWDFVATIVPEGTEGYSDLMRLLIEFGRGNPLFLIELIRALMVEEAIVRDGTRWQIARERLNVPAVGLSLAEIIIRRTKQLSNECKKVLGTASCVGRTFSSHLLADIVGLPVRDLLTYLDEALRSRLVLRRGVVDGDNYSFTHDRIHETFYQSVDPIVRRNLHLLIAQTLERQNQADPRKAVYELAFHFLRADEPARAFRYVLQAADAAQYSMAMHQAAQYLEQGLDLLGRLPTGVDFLAADPSPLRAAVRQRTNKPVSPRRELEERIREDLADVYLFIGEYDKAIENYNRVRSEGMDLVSLAVLERKIGTVYVRRGDLPLAIEHFHAGIRHLRGGMSQTRVGAIAHSIWYMLLNGCQFLLPARLRRLCFSRRQQQVKELVAMYNLTSFAYFWVDVGRALEVQAKARFLVNFLDHSSVVTRVLDQMIVFWSLFSVGWLSRRNARVSQSICRELGDQHALGNSLYYEGLSHQFAGRLEQASKVFQQAIKIHEQIGALFELELEYTSYAQSLRHMGRLDQACDYLLKSKEIAEAVRDFRGIADAHYELAEYFYYTGNFEEARRNVAICFEYTTKDSNPLLYAIAKRVLAKILLREGKTEQAIELLEESRQVAAGRKLAGEYIIDNELSLGEAYLRRLKENPEMSPKERRRTLRRVASLQRQTRFSSSTYRNYLGSSYRLKGLLRAAQHRTREARFFLGRAASMMERAGQLYELGRTKVALADLLESTDQTAATRLRADAYLLFESCNARGDMRQLAISAKAIDPGRISSRLVADSSRGGGSPLASPTLDSILVSSSRRKVDEKPTEPVCQD